MTWSKNDTDFLINNYKEKTVKELSKILNKKPKSVREKLSRLGIKLAPLNRSNFYEWSNSEVDFILKNYKTMEDKDIAKALFGSDETKYTQRVFRKRYISLGLKKPERGLIYLNNKKEYKSRFYQGERIFEHIEVMENHIGRKLEKGEIVHHIDGNKKNNDISNLYLCEDITRHHEIHYNLYKISNYLVEKGIIIFNRETGKYELRKDIINGK